MPTTPKESPLSSIESSLADEPTTPRLVIAPAGDRDPPLRGETRVPSISRDLLRAFLKRPSTHERIRRTVLARVSRKTPKHVAEEMIQEANIAVMTSRWAPRCLETARGWVGAVTVRAMVSYLRRGAKDPRWMKIEEEVVDAHSQAEVGHAPPERWLISRWLGRAVANSERDQETLEILAYQVRTNKSHEEIAAEHGMTVGALRSRIAGFRAKHKSLLERRRAVLALLALGGIALVAIAAWVMLAHP